MYSFEGKFRTTPNVSLGGKRKQDKIDKKELLLKAQQERQKREDIRRRLRCALIIQSSVRSFLARQHLKRRLRNEFDASRAEVPPSGRRLESLFFLSSRLKFFYNPNEDNERLVWFGQQIIKDKKSWLSEDGNSLLHTLGTLRLACKCLSTLDPSSSYAIPLRILETFTDWKFLTTTLQWNDDDAKYYMLKLWEKLVDFEFFGSIIKFSSDRVPPRKESQDGSIPKPTPLAQSMISLLIRPIIVAAGDGSSKRDEESMEVSYSQFFLLQNKIMESFIHKVLLPRPTPTLYHNVYPILGGMMQFPVEEVLELILHNVENDHAMRPWILASLAKIIHHKLETISISCFSNYLQCLKRLLPRLPPVNHSSEEVDSDDEISDDEHEAMEEGAHQSQVAMLQDYGFINDGHSAPASELFINAIVDRKVYDSEANLDAICAICYQLIAKRRVNIQKNRLLRTLAFSSSFLRKLWNSTITSSTTSKVTGRRVLVVHLLLDGSPMSPDEASLIRSKVVVFCALFNLHLLAVPDKDFYSGDVNLMTFSSETLRSISVLMRDICLSMIKRALPELKFRKYDAKSVVQALSEGRPVNFGRTYETVQEMKDINEYIYLFNVCRRLVKHLHTRDSRISFIPKGSWFSNSINMAQSRNLATRWHQRASSDNSVAAHLTNTADDAAVLTVQEARQIAVMVNIPFVVPFDNRVAIFMSMLQKDREIFATDRERALLDAGFGSAAMTNEISIRRDFIYEDAFNDLSQENAPDLRKQLRVNFVNAAGLDEAGYGAGVTREFLQQVVKAGFSPTRGLFRTTTEGLLYPNPHASSITRSANDHFYFLGRLLGKVIYEGMQVELPFASFFLCKILQRKSSDVDINHLQSLDPDFYKNLMYLHEYVGDITDLGLNFTVVDEALGVTKVTELVKDGKNTPVTNKNKDMYIHMMAHYKLNVQMREPCYHFRRGLENVVRVDWLQMFDHEEFRTLVSGSEVPIDIDDMKAHTVYSGGYTESHPTIKAFWEVLSEIPNEQLSLLMLFVTSCSRPPLLGFKELDPPFCIQRVDSEDRLPSASTCLNLLKLPEYPDAETLKTKLLYCLQSQSGFELS